MGDFYSFRRFVRNDRQKMITGIAEKVSRVFRDCQQHCGVHNFSSIRKAKLHVLFWRGESQAVAGDQDGKGEAAEVVRILCTDNCAACK